LIQNGGGTLLDTLEQDLRYAGRTLRKSPGFSVAALCAVALGVGANTAISSVVNAVLIAPLPYPHADRLVMFFNTSREGSRPIDWATRFDAVRQQTDFFEETLAYRLVGVNVAGDPEPEHVFSWQVSSDFFRLFGAQMAIGRTFNADEEDPLAVSNRSSMSP
jgi:putative ABC transport system permease protein